MRCTLTQLWLGALVVWTGCEPLGSYRGPDTKSSPGTSEDTVVAYPSVVDFGTVSVDGGPAQRVLTLANPGDHTITVYGFDQPVGLYGDDAGVFTVDHDSPYVDIAPGEDIDVRVSFAPPTDGRWEAALLVQPGDQTIEVVGRGAAPVVGVDTPPSATANIGCEDSVAVDIFNQGSDRLRVTGLRLDDPWDAWDLAADPTPATVDPGERLRVRYTFAPEYMADSHGPRPATLTVETDDPRTPLQTVTLDGLAVQVDGVEEQFTYNPGAAVDLLVVADTDGVMGLQIPAVAAAMPALVDELHAVGATLHSAVVTGGSPCPETFPAFADLSVERFERASLLQDGLEGDAGAGSDRLGEHTVATLAQDFAGGCLEGFLRDDARLHVVLVAGDADLSTLRSSTQLAQIEAKAPNAANVFVSAILPTDTFGCDGTRYAPTYAELAVQSDGAVIDLCSDDLSGAMSQVADASVADLQAALEHTLGREPIPESIVVEVDGEVFDDFTYRVLDQTVVFDADHPPRAGATVVVRYRALEAC
mgnify:CR=1 FL=1